MNRVTTSHKAQSKNALIFRSTFLALVTMMTACAGQVPVQPIAAGTSIQLTTPESRLRGPSAQGGEAVGKGLAKGAGMGMVGGMAAGLYGSATCGPFFMFCAPVLAGGGAAIGLVAGGTVGTVSGAMIALPNEKAKALDAIIESTLADKALSQSLRAEFEDQTIGVWTVSDAERDVRVTIELESFLIEQYKDDNLRLKMTSTMIVTNGPGKHATTDEIPFSYEGPRHHVDTWLENDGASLRIEIADAFASNVSQMIRVLQNGSAGYANSVAGL